MKVGFCYRKDSGGYSLCDLDEEAVKMVKKALWDEIKRAIELNLPYIAYDLLEYWVRLDNLLLGKEEK